MWKDCKKKKKKWKVKEEIKKERDCNGRLEGNTFVRMKTRKKQRRELLLNICKREVEGKSIRKRERERGGGYMRKETGKREMIKIGKVRE